MAGDESTIGALLDETGGSIKTGPFGTKLKASEYTATGVPVISVGEVGFGRLRIRHDTPRVDETVSSRMPEFLLKAGDIVFGRKGAVERSAQLQPDEDGYFLGSDGIRIRLNIETCDPKFIAYQLQTMAHRIWMIQHAAGTTMPSLNEGIIRRIPIVLKPLPEQKAIASILGALDDKIELNRRMNATLETMARALFQSWFVDFDPVRAKLDGRPPTGLDPETAALFPATFQDSSIGHIPQGWEVTTLGACIGFSSGFSFKSKDWQESGVPVVKIGSVKPGIIDLLQVSYVSEEIAQQAARYRLGVGDLLIGMTGYVGEVGLVPPTDNLPLLNQRVGKFVLPKPGTESLGFWYCTTRQPEFRAFVEARSHGTAQANVSGEAIKEFPVVLPSKEILGAFNKICQHWLDRILANHTESRTLAAIRDALLPKLLSGELVVSEARGCI